MQIEDGVSINETPPLIGEHVFIKNGSGKIEKVRVAMHLKNKVYENVTHVFFASLNQDDNIYKENGVPFCVMQTYGRIKSTLAMKDEFLFKRILRTTDKKHIALLWTKE